MENMSYIRSALFKISDDANKDPLSRYERMALRKYIGILGSVTDGRLTIAERDGIWNQIDLEVQMTDLLEKKHGLKGYLA